MAATDLKSLEWKRNRAIEDGGLEGIIRRAKIGISELGVVSVYHSGIYNYLRWTLAMLPTTGYFPDPEDNMPVVDNSLYWEYLKKYGRYRRLPDVPDFLQYLLGDGFTTVFGFDAGLVDYEYLANVLVEVSATLSPVPLSIAGAIALLNKQIAQMKSAANIDPASLIDTEQPTTPSPIKWVGDNIEIVQLGYALIKADKVKGMSDKKLIQALGAFFGREIDAPSNALGSFKGNSNKKSTLIDRLKEALDEFLSK